MPGEVPEGWSVAHLGELVTEHHDRVGGRTDLLPLSLTKHDGLISARERFGRALHSRDISRYRHVRRDDIVVDPMLLWDGALARLRRFDEGFVSPDYRVFRACRHRADLSFLEQWLQGPAGRHAFANNARGTNIRRNRIGREDFIRVEVLTPPLPEQKEIAAILASVDEAIQATQAVIDQTRRVKDGLLQDLLTRGLPGHTRFKQTEIGEIPESWEVTTLGAIADKGGLQTGPFGSQLHASDYSESGVPVVMPKDIVNGKLTDSSVARIPDAFASALQKHLLRRGDIVFGRRGDIGRSALVTASQVGWICGTGCLRMRPSNRVHPPYLIHRLQHGPSVRWLNENAVGQTMLNLNTTILGALPLSLPPLSEQILIATHLEDADSAREAAINTLTNFHSAKAGLLQDLLTGRVRVSA